MNKISLIAKREFLTRVQKKTFLLTTILLPLIIFGFYALIIYFSVSGNEGIRLAVADESGLLKDKLKSNDEVTFEFVNKENTTSLRKMVNDSKYDGYIFFDSATDSIQIVSEKSFGLITRDNIQDKIDEALEEKRLSGLNITKAQIDSAKAKSNTNFSTIRGEENSDLKAGVSYVVGMISGFLIYIILFIYGSMVMRGVMEEKVSRIAEVIVSSVKPYQLMMGKIFGIGAVGLVQFIIWILLMFGLQLLLPLIFPDMLHQMQAAPIQPASVQVMESANNGALSKVMEGLGTINFPVIIGCFIFYFLGGYLIYSSLFAAVGSAVNEDPQDAQSLMLPVTMPIIFAIVIMMKAVNDPTSGLAVFGSLFPLTSPIVMVARVAQGVPDPVPVWQLLLSMALLILGFLGTTWMAAKIYRTGILMYGKKVTWKEMWKWAFKKA